MSLFALVKRENQTSLEMINVTNQQQISVGITVCLFLFPGNNKACPFLG